MNTSVVVTGNLRVDHIEGSRSTLHSFEPKEMKFSELDISSGGRVFEWSARLKHLHGEPNVLIRVFESIHRGSIDRIEIALRSCDLAAMPRLRINEDED
jgi:hypothetical protein